MRKMILRENMETKLIYDARIKNGLSYRKYLELLESVISHRAVV